MNSLALAVIGWTLYRERAKPMWSGTSRVRAARIDPRALKQKSFLFAEFDIPK
jgi:hypothetical protein